MNEIKIHKILENIKREGFYYDVMDIEELTVRQILCHYGIYDDITEDEELMLLAQLRKWAEEYQDWVMTQFTLNKQGGGMYV